MTDLPNAVLYSCTMNAVRSPIAEGIMKHYFGHQVYVDSVGVRQGETSAFVIAVMEEIGIDLSRHNPKTFDQLEDTSYDLVISLSPDAQHRAVELTRTMACELEYWQTFDATVIQGSRETILDAFRDVRDSLLDRILRRFSDGVPPGL
jgi:protein-tyrosine-phosphatase